MSAKSDHVFVIKDKALDSLPLRPFRLGLFGKTLEDALQTLVERYPAVLPGHQMDPGSDDPPRFALLRREAPVGGWSLDHLMVDQRGVLTLVEAKLTENPESRRDVMGQILEYAANARDAWSNGAAHVHAEEYWRKRGQRLEDVLRQRFGDDLDIDSFWGMVEENLRSGHLRLIIVGDEIRPEVRRIIEYLNSEMTNVEVFGLELRCFGEEGDEVVLVPTLVGQTQMAADRKVSRGKVLAWTPNLLREAYAGLGDGVGQRLRQVLGWAEEKGIFWESKSQAPAFGLWGSKGIRILSFYQDGSIYVQLGEDRYAGGAPERERFIDRLNQIAIFGLDKGDAASGRNARGKVTDMDEAELKKFFGVCEEFCRKS